MARPSYPVAVIEWVAFKVALTVLLTLPRWMYLRFFAFIGWLACWVSPRYARVSRQNLRRAFPDRFSPMPHDPDGRDTSDPSLEAFLRLYYQHLFLSFTEGFFGPRLMTKTGWPRCWTVLMTDKARETFLRHRHRQPGVLFCTGHIGPWELSIHPPAIAGLPMDVVARPLDSFLVDAEANAMRDRFGNRTVSKFNNLTSLMRSLKNGRSLGLVADQDAGVHARGIFVKFFGRWCKAVDAPAVLAMMYQAPLIPSFPIRTSMLRPEYLLLFGDPIDISGDPRNPHDVQRILQDYHHALEDIVRRYPEQYEWLHHKWRTRPPGEVGAHPRHIDQQPDAEEKARLLGYYGGDTPAHHPQMRFGDRS